MEITVAIIALLVSIISLIASFLQPEIRKWFKKKFFRYKLNFIAIDNLILFFNRAGSYLRLSVTLQPPNDAMTIKNVAVEVKNCKSGDTRILNWSALLPLFTQNFGSMSLESFSQAAPERILQDDIRTLKIEFSDVDNQRNEKLQHLTNNIINRVNTLDLSQETKELVRELSDSTEIASLKNELSEDFFWKAGAYTLDVIVTDSLDNEYSRTVYFDISTQEHESFRKNIDEFFVCEIKQRKNQISSFFTAIKNFATKTLKNSSN